MIPKIIHFCWFGDQSIPEDQQSLIKEWQEILPDYELKLWNEENSFLDNNYCQTALANKKWANLSNYVRFQALLSEGGIYLDTDIKLLRSFDPLLHYKCFLGFENDQEVIINNAVIASVSGHPFIAECLQAFDVFTGEEQAHESAPLLVTSILKNQYNVVNTETQELNNIALLSKDFFYPIHWNETYKLKDYKDHITDNTYCVHLWNKSWFTPEMLHNTISDWQKWASDLSNENSRLNEIISVMATKETYNAEIQLAIKTVCDAVQRDIAKLEAGIEKFANEARMYNENSINELKYIIERNTHDIKTLNEKYVHEIELLLNRVDFLKEKDKLEKTISENEASLKWYKETYEQRSLLGLIKQWLIKRKK